MLVPFSMKYSRLLLSRFCLSRITAYLSMKIWSLLKHEILTINKTKYCGKGGENLATSYKLLWNRGDIGPKEPSLLFLQYNEITRVDCTILWLFLSFSPYALSWEAVYHDGISWVYSRLSLSQSPRVSLKCFEISVPRHIRFQSWGKNKLNNHILQMNM